MRKNALIYGLHWVTLGHLKCPVLPKFPISGLCFVVIMFIVIGIVILYNINTQTTVWDTLYTQTVKYGQFAFLQVARYFAKICQKCHILQKCKKLTGTPAKFPLITRKKYQKRLIISEVILISKISLLIILPYF